MTYSYYKHEILCHFTIPMFSTLYTALINCYSNSTERNGSRKNNNGVEAQSLFDFFLFCVLGTLVNNSLEEFGISNTWTQLLWKLCRGSALCRMKNDFNRCTVHHLNLLKVTRYIQLDAIFRS